MYCDVNIIRLKSSARLISMRAH